MTGDLAIFNIKLGRFKDFKEGSANNVSTLFTHFKIEVIHGKFLITTHKTYREETRTTVSGKSYTKGRIRMRKNCIGYQREYAVQVLKFATKKNSLNLRLNSYKIKCKSKF